MTAPQHRRTSTRSLGSACMRGSSYRPCWGVGSRHRRGGRSFVCCTSRVVAPEIALAEAHVGEPVYFEHEIEVHHGGLVIVADSMLHSPQPACMSAKTGSIPRTMAANAASLDGFHPRPPIT